jgi:type VI secretion system protein VasG
MAEVTPKSLIAKLNDVTHRALNNAVGLAVSRTQHPVEIEHWLLKMFEATDSDLHPILKQYDLDPARVRAELGRAIDQFKTGHNRPPTLAPDLIYLASEAWLIASIEFGAPKIRSSHLLLAFLTTKSLAAQLRTSCPELAKIGGEQLQKDFREIASKLPEHRAEEQARAAEAGPGGAPAASSKTPSLDQFTMNLTERAKKGDIDPVVGRDNEIRQVIDILTRRRQNNPILTGEAGVGKTAVVEGLALRIVAGDVPGPLKNVTLRTLDLGLLQAGAGVKGEFENRLKSVIQEVKQSPTPIILFIDEAHTMIGAGGQAGQGDAANLLKPALARGELRTIAATTFDEYKKYFETDPALKRRFQEVKVDEPDEARAVRMLRGVAKTMEKHHNVRVLDEALVETVHLGVRYIPERQLPDKAVSLLDTACARVKLSQGATPPALEDCIREIEHLTTEIAAVEREQRTHGGHEARLGDLQERRKMFETRRDDLTKRLDAERKLVDQIRTLQENIEKAAAAADGKAPAPDSLEKDKHELLRLRIELANLQGETPLVYPFVDGAVISEIVAGWTGIPVGKMVRNEIETVLHLQDRLADRVVGQNHALDALAQRIRTARADLADPRRPIGVFLLVGPSGVGKTETAMALADLLYGGDRNMVVINMSEFKEEYKVSQLIGSPRGYEGSSEGGVLTEAVRRRPYSVVLLDEVEKSHPSVQEIFYQVFDKGMLTDSRGIEVNFKNTIILLTSNVGTDTIMKYCADPDTIPTAAQLGELLRPDLLKSFKPALLGRMVVVPYFPLSDQVLRTIIQLQLKKIKDRIRINHKAEFSYDDSVVNSVAGRCKEVESGARNVDHILTGTMLPAVAREVLNRMAEGKPLSKVHIGVDGNGQFTYGLE